MFENELWVGGRSRRWVWMFRNVFRCLKRVDRSCERERTSENGWKRVKKRENECRGVKNGCECSKMAGEARKWAVGRQEGWQWVVEVDSGLYLFKNASEIQKRANALKNGWYCPKMDEGGRFFSTKTRVARLKEVGVVGVRWVWVLCVENGW